MRPSYIIFLLEDDRALIKLILYFFHKHLERTGRVFLVVLKSQVFSSMLSWPHK